MVTFVYPSGVIEYFDDTVDLDNRLNLAQVYEPIRNLTRIDYLTTRSGHLIVYKDSKCKGKELHSNLDDGVHSVDTSFDYLVGQGMEDEISSIDLTCTYVVNDPHPTTHGNRCTALFFADPYYMGYSIYFYIDPYTPHSYIHYFKSYPLYPGSSKDWNDKVSSYRFFYN